MGQAVRYNALPLAELAPAPSAIITHFTQMRRLETPGILIPEAGGDGPTAMATLRPLLAALDLSIHRTIPPIWHRNGQGDQPLHIDAIPSDEASVGMVLQYTVEGRADVVLAKLADPFCKELRQRNAGFNADSFNYDLPENTDALLDEGLIDPEILQPDIYVGSVAMGSAILFTFGGPNPIAHRFRTTTPQRHAQGYIVPFTRL